MESHTASTTTTTSPRKVSGVKGPSIRQVTIISVLPMTRSWWRPKFGRGQLAVGSACLVFVILQLGLKWSISNEVLPVQDPVFLEKIELYRPWITNSSGALPRVVALGSSRTQLGFDAKHFADWTESSAFNFGCSAAGPMTCSLYFRRIMNEPLPKPDYVFVEIHPGFWSPIDPPFESRWLHPYRLRPGEAEHLRALGYRTGIPAQHSWHGSLATAYHYRFALLNRYASKMLPCPYGLTVGVRSDGFGFVGGIDVEPAQKPKALQHTYEQYAPAFPSYTVGGAGLQSTRDLLAVAQQQGIRAALVLPPESSEFRGWYGIDGYEQITHHAQELAKQFGVPLFDARAWLSDDLIADGHHLTNAGAKALTERLAREARSWLRAR